MNEVSTEVIADRIAEAKDNLRGLRITDDETLLGVLESLKRVKVSLKELPETPLAIQAKELYEEYKRLNATPAFLKKELEEIESILKSHISVYAVARANDLEQEQADRLLEAAIKTGDEALLEFPIIPEKLPAIDGITYAEVKKFAVEEPEAVPETYKVVDEKKIRKVVQALGMDTDIPGVKVYLTTQVRVSV